MAADSDSAAQTTSLVEQNLSRVSDAQLAQHRNDDTIDLTGNRLRSGVNLDRFSRMHTLILDKNEMTAASFGSDFPVLPNVTTLWLNHNQFTDLIALVDVVARCCPNVTYVSMMKNPCVPDMYFGTDSGDADAYQRYRYYVVYRLTHITMLDATPVDAVERKEAMSCGARMAPRKPVAAARSGDGDSDQSGQSGQSGGSADHKSRRPKAPEGKPGAFLAKGKPRYDGSNSEGNRFIVNDDL